MSATPPELADLQSLPRDAEGPVFRAPWEAQAFGLTLALYERGLFTWREWTDALTVEIKAADAPDDGTRYYEYWLAALERIAAEKGLVTVAEMLQRKDDWDMAARATPHGKPIELKNRPPR